MTTTKKTKTKKGGVALTTTREYMLDLAERSAATFIQTALGVIVATGGFGIDVLKAALVAGGLAVAKAIVARYKGDPESASLVK